MKHSQDPFCRRPGEGKFRYLVEEKEGSKLVVEAQMEHAQGVHQRGHCCRSQHCKENDQVVVMGYHIEAK